jgi:hypothetical protein
MVSDAHIRGHDDDGVFETGHAAPVVGQAAVVEHLQQDVEGIGVRFFDFVEQDDGVRLAAHGLGELAAFFVAYISRRRAHEPRHVVAFLVFAHVDAGDGFFVVEEHLGEGFGQLGFAHAGRTEEDERADGAVGVAGGRRDCGARVGYGAHGFVLPDEAFVQFVFEEQQFVFFALQHAGHGDAGPAGHYFGDVVGGDLLVGQAVFFGQLAQFFFGAFEQRVLGWSSP